MTHARHATKEVLGKTFSLVWNMRVDIHLFFPLTKIHWLATNSHLHPTGHDLRRGVVSSRMAIGSLSYRWGLCCLAGWIFPLCRSYYRCGESETKSCPAKRHVDRYTADSSVAQQTHTGEHCHAAPMPKRRATVFNGADVASSPLGVPSGEM